MTANETSSSSEHLMVPAAADLPSLNSTAGLANSSFVDSANFTSNSSDLVPLLTSAFPANIINASVDTLSANISQLMFPSGDFDSEEYNGLNETSTNISSWNVSIDTTYRNDWNGSMYPSGYSTFTIILTSIFLTAIMVVVVVGNMLVCIAILTENSLKTIQNWFIASLAVSDFLLGLVVMPFSLARELMGYWIFGTICLDRYWSITKAVEYLKTRTARRAGFMIVMVWILAAIISLPPLAGWKETKTQEIFPTCYISRDVGYVLYSAAGSFFIPAVVMVFVYIRIFFAARSRAFRNVKRRPQYPEITNDPARDKSTTTTTTTTSFSNASPPDGSKFGSPSDVSRSPMFFRKSPLPQNKVEKSDVDKDKNCNTSNSLSIPIPTTPTVQVLLPTGGLKKGDRSPCSEKKIVTLGNVEFKHMDKNSYMTDHKELSEIYEDGEDLSQTQSSEAEETSVADGLRNGNNRKPKKMTCSTLCCTFFKIGDKNGNSEHSKNNGTIGKNKKRRKSKKKKDKKRQQVTENQIHTAADSERLKRRVARAKERRATFILGLIMIAFILSWMPFFITYVVQALIGKAPPNWLFAFVFWLGYCNSALNPIIYTIFNRDFRKAFRKILFK
ncbi:Tyramine/octopamine receptor [Nymphon striatum]|nr:Tyramine/octopamine receptor [Nymphon striatum]